MALHRYMRHFAVIFTLGSGAALQAASLDPRLPDYYPTCNSPQPGAPARMAGGSQINSRSSVVWNGREYGVAWVDMADNLLHFRRFFSDGTPAGAVITVSSLYSDSLNEPTLAWNGAGYGVTWVVPTVNYNQVEFARLAADGTLIGSETRVSSVGTVETADSKLPVLSWSGGGYAVTWFQFVLATNYDILATLLNPDGTIANAGTSHDLVISNAVDIQSDPSVAWSGSTSRYVIVWSDFRSQFKNELYGATLTAGGAVSANGLLVTDASGFFNAYYPHLVDAGGVLGMVWHDSRDVGLGEIYFSRITGGVAKLGADVRLTNDLYNSRNARIAWTGAEFGVVWQDLRGSTYNTWFQRVSVDGVAQGGNVQVSHSVDMQFPDVAFARFGYLITDAANGFANQVQPWSCDSVTLPPSCPGNFNAYNITGTSASVTWSPSGDPLSDIAYYQVYRNNVAVGKASAAYFNDGILPLPPLPLSSTNNYMIQPVNAHQLQNYTCTSSIYVKTNATLTLTLNKSSPDAVLNWTDAGFNSYNVFRGNDPRVMSQIGATPSLTSPDANALNSNLSYFYSVDNPGP